ncbi:MAG: hypothetical protein IK017_11215 [Paludibacteraceae bacterium]|nr:hypothetical protein [Paludibacteraceae bacterium]
MFSDIIRNMKKLFYILTLIGLCSCSSNNICGKWETEDFFVVGATDQEQSAFVAYEKNAIYTFYENGRYEIENPCKNPPTKVPGLILNEVGNYTFTDNKVTLVSDTIVLYEIETEEIMIGVKQRTNVLSVVNCKSDKLSLQLDIPSKDPRLRKSAHTVRNMRRIE